jgi:hypothetical protein
MHDKIVKGTATVVLLLVILFVIFPMAFAFLMSLLLKGAIVTSILAILIVGYSIFG